MEASFFPVSDLLLYSNPQWQSLSSTGKIMLAECISQANLWRGEFYRSFNWAVRMHVDFETIRRNQQVAVVAPF
jgi:hypothetical protein